MNGSLMVKDLQKDESIESILDARTLFLEKGYLEERNKYIINNLPDELENFSNQKNIRMIKITKFVYDEKENIPDKLSNVYTALYGTNSSIFLILKSDGKECSFYLGIRSKESVNSTFLTLKSSLNGNFSGIEYENNIDNSEIGKILNYILRDEVKEVTTVTGIPSFKEKDKNNFIQGMEKLIDGMEGKEFTAILIANSIDYQKIKNIKRGYEDIYNEISPFNEVTMTLSENEAQSISKSVGTSLSETSGYNLSRTDSSNSSYSFGRSEGKNSGWNTSLGIVGINRGSNTSFSNTEGNGSSNSKSFGTNRNDTKTETNTDTVGNITAIGQAYQIKKENKTFITLSEKIKKQLERIENAEGNGFWETGIFFLSEEPQNSIIAANIYNGIIRGENSGIEKNGVYHFNNLDDVERIKDYLSYFYIPQIYVKVNNNFINSSISSVITTEELSLQLNLPKKSVSGIDVVKMAAFGRHNKKDINEKDINIGKLYHLGKVIDKKIGLNIETLTSHTFVTGSTGSGKSNAVYCLVDKLSEKNINFLVIEPAKGEYKNVFGGRKDVSVYGTNKKYTELLKINPFSFNDEIHILEHIDRLVEIFNACWPMYAAMPSILKNAIEKAYMAVGWNLKESINLFNENKYPTFETLKLTLEDVIKSSEYSDEIKGNYKGALLTRVSSLARGLLGNVFTDDEISERDLFDKNVIVDISRIPSVETKSLVMGILFMKLHEYKIAVSSSLENQKLNHVTILEEAHNLLKRTSLEQSQESGNLQGKSVEMMTNAIAEMRTYGEGFIIVDQAPELLDLAVIRNTNTKICLKLPNLSDRELIGKAMDLDDNQIKELAKLEVGVAAVIQNDWEEACLVKFNYMRKRDQYTYSYSPMDKDFKKNIMKYIFKNDILKENRLDEKTTNEVYNFLKKEGIKVQRLNEEKEKVEATYKILDGKSILSITNAISVKNYAEWQGRMIEILENILNIDISREKELLSVIAKAILNVVIEKGGKYEEIYKNWDELKNERRVF